MTSPIGPTRHICPVGPIGRSRPELLLYYRPTVRFRDHCRDIWACPNRPGTPKYSPVGGRAPWRGRCRGVFGRLVISRRLRIPALWPITTIIFRIIAAIPRVGISRIGGPRSWTDRNHDRRHEVY